MTLDVKDNVADITKWATDITMSWPGLFSKLLTNWINDSNFIGEIILWNRNKLDTVQVYKSTGFIKTIVSDLGLYYFKKIIY